MNCFILRTYGFVLAHSLCHFKSQANYVQENIESFSRNHCCSRKAVSIVYCECVFVALVIQHAKRMRRIILSSVACPALQYFPTLSHKWQDLGGGGGGGNYGT